MLVQSRPGQGGEEEGLEHGDHEDEAMRVKLPRVPPADSKSMEDQEGRMHGNTETHANKHTRTPRGGG